MKRRNWKAIQPNSLRHALELCKEYALARKNLSVERIAELMGLADHWTLYKWISTGRMPMVMVPVYEGVCGCYYITRWLASSSGKLVIDIPTGRTADAGDMQTLQAQLNTTTGALLNFYTGKVTAEETLAAVTQALEILAWHRGNVAQHDQPQLELANNNESDTHDDSI